MQVSIFQSGQGLLSVAVNGAISPWKIDNRRGVWSLYKASGTDFMRHDENLSSLIHNPKALSARVAELIADAK